MEDFFVNDIYSISLSHRYQFYDMNLRISLGVSKFWLNQNGVIADTGTTLLIVSKKVMAGIQSNFATICKTTDLVGVCNATTGKTLFDGYCYPMTDAQVCFQMRGGGWVKQIWYISSTGGSVPYHQHNTERNYQTVDPHSPIVSLGRRWH